MPSAVRVAVVTGYYQESPDQLSRCVQSVMAQTHPCTHFLVSDGYPSDLIATQPVRHVQLGVAHRDYGDTPRAIGSLLARREGFDAIAYLDADNYYLPEHIAGLVAAWEDSGRQLDLITASRFLLRLDGSRLPPYPETSPWRATDTNGMFLANRALALTPIWTLMPARFHVIGDHIFWHCLHARGLRINHLPVETVGYTTLWRIDYDRAGEPAPPGAKDLGPPIVDAARWWQALAPDEKQGHLDIMGYDPSPAFATVLRDGLPNR